MATLLGGKTSLPDGGHKAAPKDVVLVPSYLSLHQFSVSSFAVRTTMHELMDGFALNLLHHTGQYVAWSDFTNISHAVGEQPADALR